MKSHLFEVAFCFSIQNNHKLLHSVRIGIPKQQTMGVVDTAKISFQSNRDLLKKKTPFEELRKNVFCMNLKLRYKEPDPETLKLIQIQNEKRRKAETTKLWVVLITISSILAGLFYTVLF